MSGDTPPEWARNIDPAQVSDDERVSTIGTWGGWLVEIHRMLFNGRLCLSDPRWAGWPVYAWCYPSMAAALAAALSWDPGAQGEPPGFVKRVGQRVRQAGERCPAAEQ